MVGGKTLLNNASHTPLAWDESSLTHSRSLIFFRLNRRGEILSASAALQNLLELAPQHLLGQPLKRFLANPPAAEAWNNSTTPISLSLINPGGTHTVEFLRNDSADGVAYLGANPMVTHSTIFEQMTVLENELVDLNRTHQKTIRELQDTREQLHRSNEELEQFAHIAAHDLQEPLRMVKSYLDLIRKRYQGKLDETGNEFLAFALDGAQRMQRMIEDLLSLSRIGKKKPIDQRTATGPLVQTAILNLQERIRECRAHILVAQDLPNLAVDPGQMVQLLQNLLANAMKFQKSKEIPPEIHIGAIRQQDGFWRFQVQDNGIGIAPEHAEKIFGLFARLHGRTKFEGSGLGLSICRKIVERHGGRIWVESTPDQGSTFYFTIPEPSG